MEAINEGDLTVTEDELLCTLESALSEKGHEILRVAHGRQHGV
jgi:hypothetical protein